MQSRHIRYHISACWLIVNTKKTEVLPQPVNSATHPTFTIHGDPLNEVHRVHLSWQHTHLFVATSHVLHNAPSSTHLIVDVDGLLQGKPRHCWFFVPASVHVRACNITQTFGRILMKFDQERCSNFVTQTSQLFRATA